MTHTQPNENNPYPMPIHPPQAGSPKTRFRPSLGAVVLLPALVLAACSDDDDGPMNDAGMMEDDAMMDDSMMDDSMMDGSEAPTTIQVTVENRSMAHELFASGTFSIPDGQTEAGPIGPGMSYSFHFAAPPGAMLSFATMFVPSNDFFYAPDEAGVALYDTQGQPRSGDITAEVMLWDAGTEVNQEPGAGMDQPQRQSGPDTGAMDSDSTVRLAPDSFNNLPATSDVLQVTLTSLGGGEFQVQIANVSDSATLMTADGSTQAVPLAPGVWAVHSDASPFFESGMSAGDHGLEGLAEDGDAAPLAAALEMKTGFSSPLAPGIWVVHTEDAPLFARGMSAGDHGLEALAEDGDPSGLAAALMDYPGVLAVGTFTMPQGESEAGPAFPGQSFVFSIEAPQGSRLSLATMLGQTNDLFFAPSQAGIPLFDEQMMARSGDMTSALMLWDAGTEVNQAPGAGPDQAPRQSGPNTGADENGPVQPVDDGYSYPAVEELVGLTLSHL